MEVRISFDGYMATFEGLFIYNEITDMQSAAEAFLKDFIYKEVKWDACIGCFLCEIKDNKKKIVFGDNSGMRRFFIDYNSIAVHKEFREIIDKDANVEPNYNAIAEFLYFGCVYSDETLIKGIFISDPNKYYVITDEKIESFQKKLKPLGEIQVSDEDLVKLIHTVCESIKGMDIFCTITGGIDSRTILSCLLYNGVRPKLNITGLDSNIDVMIAREIAQKTGLDLLQISENDRNQNWINEMINAASIGCTGICGYYRLYEKAKKISEYGQVVEFGGVAGEMYKNSFINQDYPFYYGAPCWKKFIKQKITVFDFPEGICGDRIQSIIRQMDTKLLNWLSKYNGKKAESYLEAGYFILQQRYAGIGMMNSHFYINYNPLLERNIAAYAFSKNPYRLEMQSFQRKQVSKYYPLLKSIKTDRGLTCDVSRKTVEWFSNMFFLVRIALERILKRKKQSKIAHNDCFKEGLESEQFKTAITRCVELGILIQDINTKSVSQDILDRLFFVGSVL